MDAQYESVKVLVEVGTPEKFSKLMEFCSENGIFVPPVPANPFQRIYLDTTKRTPTAEFKAFCGPSWMTRDGTISVLDVHSLILDYARVHKLVNQDGSIDLPPQLKEALRTDRNRVYRHDLPALAAQAF
jgi:hypothetical protein